MSLNPAKMYSLKSKHNASEAMGAVNAPKKVVKKVVTKTVGAKKVAKKAAPKRTI